MGHTYTLVTVIVALLSIGVNAFVIERSQKRARHDRRADMKAVQAAHIRPTARLGGLGVFAGFSVGTLFISYLLNDITPALLMLSGLPIFLAGLLEDLGVGQSPRRRLLASAVSAVLATVFTSTYLSATGLQGIDDVLAILPIGIGITVFWSAGVCNAFNLIDGVNGLAGFVAISIALAMSYVSWSAGDVLMAQVAFVLAAAIGGFLIFNWPLGYIFFGDAGAYTVGHILVWMSLLISVRNPSVEYIALSLMFFWPVADTFLAIWRRSHRKRNMMHPDYLHVHQFVMRAIQLRWKLPLPQANPLTTVVLVPLFLAPVFAAIILLQSPIASLFGWILFGILFTAAYQIGLRRVRRQEWRNRGRRTLEAARMSRAS